MPALPGKGPEQCNRFRPHQRIEAIERLIENQYPGIVRNRLSQTNALAHSFTVAADLAMGRLPQPRLVNGSPGKLVAQCLVITEQQQVRVNELIAGEALRE